MSDSFPSLFISGSGTGVGKTLVTRGLARALLQRGLRVAALKPVETGCQPDPADAIALARAAGQPGLAQVDGFYRSPHPLAPHAIALAELGPPAALESLLAITEGIARDHDVTLVEGAGGLLVPLDAQRSFAEFASELHLPLLLVAPDRLGVLSHALTAYESARVRGMEVRALILVDVEPRADDPSPATNQRVLQQRLRMPVLRFEHIAPDARDDDDALAAAAERAGLLSL